MNEILVGILGLLCIAAIVIILLRGRTQPAITFILCPTALAVILIIGKWYSFDDIAAMIRSGFSSTAPTAALFVFSILFFGIMNGTGMFDVIIRKLMAMVRNSVVGVAMVTATITLVCHLDCNGASTFCILIPAMLPVYRRMRMRETTLLRIGIVCMGAMNLLPWSGASLRTATVLGMEGSKLWHTLLPVQFFAIALSLGHAFLAGIQEKAGGAGAKDSPTNIGERETLTEVKAGSEDLARPNRFLINILLTIAVIALLTWNRFPGYYPTMLGAVAALFVNYGFNAAFHRKIINRHAAPALTMCITMMGAAVLMGIMTSSIGADGKVLPSSMIELPPDAVPSVMRCLASLISAALPAALGKHLHLLLCALAVPLALTFDTDSYFYGMLPVMLGIGQAFGLEVLPIAITMQILRLSATFICPMTAAVHLGTGMADVTIRNHIKASALYVWSFSFLCLLFAIFIGLVPF